MHSNTTPKTPEQNLRIFTRDFVLMFVGNFIIVSVYFLLMTTMALYSINEFSTDSATGGAAASIFLVGAVVGRVICGRYASWIGLRKLTLIALAIQIAMCFLYFANFLGVGFLICVRFVHGFSFGIANTTIPAMAVEGLPPNRLGEGTGYFMLSNSLGVGIGPLMSILVVMGIEYRILFVICSALAVVVLVTTLLANSGRTFAKGPRPGRFTIGSFIDKSTVKLSVFMFFVAFSYSSLNSFINVYAAENGWGFYAPFVFLIYSAVLLISRPITGKLMDRRGENFVLYPSIAAMAVGLAIAGLAVNPVMLLSCGIFMALGFGTCMSIGQAAATKHTKMPSVTLAISTFFLLCDAGCGLGPVFLGLIANSWGLRVMYGICTLIAIGAMVYYHFAHGSKKKG